MGELCGVFCEDLGENCWLYNDNALCSGELRITNDNIFLVESFFSALTQTKYIDIYSNICNHGDALGLLSFDQNVLQTLPYTHLYNFPDVCPSALVVEWGNSFFSTFLFLDTIKQL